MGETKAEWQKCPHGEWRLHLGRRLTLSVYWDSTRRKSSDEPPYVAYALGAKLRHHFKTLNEAKTAAERVARKMLTTALERLPETPEP